MKMPQDWNAAGTKITAGTQVEAKIDMSADVVGKGLCPECKKPMVKAFVGTHQAWTCVADRVALPVENE